MDHFADYGLRDFLEDEAFVRWVKYPDESGDQFWNLVGDEHPHLIPLMKQARELIHGLSTYYPEVPESEVEIGRQAILQATQESANLFPHWLVRYGKMAAMLVLVAGLAWWLASRNETPPVPQVHELAAPAPAPSDELYNNTGETRVFVLADGSSVHLEPESRLRFVEQGIDAADTAARRGDARRGDARRIDARREAYLEGEGFFKVARNPEKPFYVYANGLVTKVLGTSFRVAAHRHAAEVKVQVSTGKVEVYEAKKAVSGTAKTGMVLTPNQQVVFKRNEAKLVRGLVEEPKMLVSPKRFEAYAYSHTPIAKIFEALEEIYGVKIVYDAEKFSKCRLTMSLSDESLYEKLYLISKVVDADYRIVDAQVVFTGSGCSDW